MTTKRELPDGTTITYTSAGRARRMDEARRSLKAAHQDVLDFSGGAA